MSGEAIKHEERYRRAAGQVVSRLRAERGMSLRDFGKRAGTSHTNLYAIESGDVTPGIEVLGGIAAAVGQDLPGLLLEIIGEMLESPKGFEAAARKVAQLSDQQQREVVQFADFLRYRDR